MITMRTSKEMIKILEKYIAKEAIPTFLDELTRVPGTNNSFRLTIRDVKNRYEGNVKKVET